MQNKKQIKYKSQENYCYFLITIYHVPFPEYTFHKLAHDLCNPITARICTY